MGLDLFNGGSSGNSGHYTEKEIEQAKIGCAKKLFNSQSNGNVVYHEVTDYDTMLNIINGME